MSDLEQQVSDLQSLIEGARGRAWRRRTSRGSAATVLGVAAFIGFGGHGGGGTVRAATARAHGSQGSTATAESAPLGALPPGAGSAQAFAFDPRNPQIVYVLTGGRGSDGTTRSHVYKTTDGGAHWQATATRGAGWTGDTESLAADPQHPGTLYAGTLVAVYKTVDGGHSWQPWNRGLFPVPGPNDPHGTPGTPHYNRGNGWVTALAVDPANSRVVYAGAGGIRKSSDGGHSWKTVFLHFPAPVQALAIAATHPEAIYALATNGYTSHSAIYKSTDAGKTWHATAALTNPDGWGGALAVDPRDPTTVYASIGRTLLRTTDAGANWQPITQGLPQQVVTALTVDTQQPETVYVALAPTYTKHVITTPGGIYKTTDHGDTWTPASASISAATLTVDPSRPTTIYAALDGRPGIARSIDSGRTWSIAR